MLYSFLASVILLASASAQSVLTCTLVPCADSASQNVFGTVTFTSGGGDLILVNATVSNLGSSTKHGFHIHEFGDMSSSDCTATGGHFNPYGTPHACPEDGDDRHVGDMGNLVANAAGTATYLEKLDLMQLTNGPAAIIGRAVIIHADPDDCTSQPTGNAGSRWAQCVIGVEQE